MTFAIARHLASIIILPGTVGIFVPIWIARRNGIAVQAPADLEAWVRIGAGFVVLAVGLTLFIASLRRFAADGEGTLAPWDPPRRLVVRGPYRYVRNPMISGLIFILIAEAIFLGSRPHAQWAAVFFLINGIYIPLVEEPMLRNRFGDAYEEYYRHVPQLWPRRTPWTPVSRQT